MILDLIFFASFLVSVLCFLFFIAITMVIALLAFFSLLKAIAINSSLTFSYRLKKQKNTHYTIIKNTKNFLHFGGNDCISCTKIKEKVTVQKNYSIPYSWNWPWSKIQCFQVPRRNIGSELIYGLSSLIDTYCYLH